MANNYRTPWRIDTTGALPHATHPKFIKGMSWVGYTTAGHQAIVQDARGAVWSLTAPDTSGDSISFAKTGEGPYYGLNVTTLGSGVILMDVE